jgi:hypothetical protein
MGSAWLDHVKSEMKAHPGLKLKEVLKIAAKSYKKSGSPASSDSKKTRKHKKHRKSHKKSHKKRRKSHKKRRKSHKKRRKSRRSRK